MRIGRINRYTSFGSEMSFTPKKGDQQSLVEIYVCSSSYPISLNCALQCSIYLFTLNWHPSTSTGDPHSCILWGVSRIWICAFQIIHHRWFFFMEVEENSSKPELSQTPELDADLPEKGLPSFSYWEAGSRETLSRMPGWELIVFMFLSFIGNWSFS